MPPSAERLMSSKKIPHNVGGMACAGCAASTEIFAVCASRAKPVAAINIVNSDIFFIFKQIISKTAISFSLQSHQTQIQLAALCDPADEIAKFREEELPSLH